MIRTPAHLRAQARFRGEASVLGLLATRRDREQIARELDDLAGRAGQALGEDDRVTLGTRRRAAEAWAKHRQSSENLNVYSAILRDGTRAGPPPEDHVMSAVRAGYGQWLRKVGRYADGIAIYRHEIELREQHFGGPSSRRASIARMNLAGALRDSDDPELLRESLQISQHEAVWRATMQQYGPSHPLTTVALAGHALTLLKVAQHADDRDPNLSHLCPAAMPADAVGPGATWCPTPDEHWNRQPNPEHRCRTKRGCAHRDHWQMLLKPRDELIAEAARLARQVVVSREAWLGLTHESTLAAMRLRGKCLMAQGQHAKAELVFIRVLATER